MLSTQRVGCSVVMGPVGRGHLTVTKEMRTKTFRQNAHEHTSLRFGCAVAMTKMPKRMISMPPAMMPSAKPVYRK